jgi:hypothetical protein
VALPPDEPTNRASPAGQGWREPYATCAPTRHSRPSAWASAQCALAWPLLGRPEESAGLRSMIGPLRSSVRLCPSVSLHAPSRTTDPSDTMLPLSRPRPWRAPPQRRHRRRGGGLSRPMRRARGGPRVRHAVGHDHGGLPASHEESTQPDADRRGCAASGVGTVLREACFQWSRRDAHVANDAWGNWI